MPTDAQPEPMPRPTRSALKVLAVGLLGFVVALVLYVASIGPAYRLPSAKRNGPIQKSFDKAYAPVWWAGDNIPGCRRLLYWWLDLWDNAPFDGTAAAT